MGICISKFKISNSNLNKVFQHSKSPQKASMWNPKYQIQIHKAKTTSSIQFRHILHLFMSPNKQRKHKTKQNWKWKSKKKNPKLKNKDNKPDKKAKNKHASN